MEGQMRVREKDSGRDGAIKKLLKESEGSKRSLIAFHWLHTAMNAITSQ